MPRVLFLHIPKTAGVSLITYLDRHFSPDQVFSLTQGRSPPAGGGGWLASGHVYGGWLDRREPGVTAVTLLRHPLARTLSQYRYWRSLSPANARDDIGRHQIGLARRYSLPDLLDLGDPIIDGSFRDLQTQMLGLDHPRAPESPPVDRSVLAMALERLAEVDCVGVTERLADAASHLAARFGWLPETTMPRENQTAAEVGDDALADRLLRFNELDLELYEAAARKAAAQAADDAKLRLMVERRLASEPVADRRCIDLAGPFVGSGWGARHQTPVGSWRVSGAGGGQLLTGPVSSQARCIDLLIEPRFSKRGTPWLRVNGHQLSLEPQADGALLRARPQSGELRDDDLNRLELGLAGPAGLPPGQGLALRSVTIGI